MTELNNIQHLKINNTTAFTFTIEDTSKFNDYLREGIVAQTKVPMLKQHESLAVRLIKPVGDEE